MAVPLLHDERALGVLEVLDRPELAVHARRDGPARAVREPGGDRARPDAPLRRARDGDRRGGRAGRGRADGRAARGAEGEPREAQLAPLAALENGLDEKQSRAVRPGPCMLSRVKLPRPSPSSPRRWAVSRSSSDSPSAAARVGRLKRLLLVTLDVFLGLYGAALVLILHGVLLSVRDRLSHRLALVRLRIFHLGEQIVMLARCGSRSMPPSARLRQRLAATDQLAWAGSNIGGWAYTVAIAVYAYREDGAYAVGLDRAARWVAAGIASPLMGVLADRFPASGSWLRPTSIRPALLGAMALLVVGGSCRAPRLRALDRRHGRRHRLPARAGGAPAAAHGDTPGADRGERDGELDRERRHLRRPGGGRDPRRDDGRRGHVSRQRRVPDLVGGARGIRA